MQLDRNKCLITQNLLIKSVEGIITKGNVPYLKEDTGGDILFILYENDINKFTVEICLEYAEFYQLPQRHKIFDAFDEGYIENVLRYFEELINKGNV